LHQTDEQRVGFVKVVVASRCAGLLGLAAQLFVRAQALGENDTPSIRLVFAAGKTELRPVQCRLFEQFVAYLVANLPPTGRSLARKCNSLCAI